MRLSNVRAQSIQDAQSDLLVLKLLLREVSWSNIKTPELLAQLKEGLTMQSDSINVSTVRSSNYVLKQKARKAKTTKPN